MCTVVYLFTFTNMMSFHYSIWCDVHVLGQIKSSSLVRKLIKPVCFVKYFVLAESFNSPQVGNIDWVFTRLVQQVITLHCLVVTAYCSLLCCWPGLICRTTVTWYVWYLFVTWFVWHKHRSLYCLKRVLHRYSVSVIKNICTFSADEYLWINVKWRV